MSAHIEEALIKARALAKAAKSRPAANGGGLAAAGEARATSGPPGAYGGASGQVNHSAPHMRAQAEGRRMFIGGLSYDTTDQSLETYLSTKWSCEEAKVKRDPEGKSRGFAFVTFPVVSILEDCFNAQPHWIDGKQVEMRKVAPDGSSGSGGQKRSVGGTKMTHYGGGGGGSGTRVFIGQAPGGRSRGLNDDIQDEDLRTYFERYGTVTGIAQHRWEDSGRKKGFGYMEFAEYEAAQSCLGIHTVCGLQLEVKPYQQGTGARAPPPQGGAPPARPPTYNSAGVSSDYGYGNGGAGYGYGYGTDNKRPRTDMPPPQAGGGGGATEQAQMMEQMKSMMVQMQQMQQMQAPAATGNTIGEQMQQMQQTMYSMMQNQYMSALGGSNSAYPSGSNSAYPSSGSSSGYPGYSATPSYQYPSTIEYPKPPKPPGTDRY